MTGSFIISQKSYFRPTQGEHFFCFFSARIDKIVHLFKTRDSHSNNCACLEVPIISMFIHIAFERTQHGSKPIRAFSTLILAIQYAPLAPSSISVYFCYLASSCYREYRHIQTSIVSQLYESRTPLAVILSVAIVIFFSAHPSI